MPDTKGGKVKLEGVPDEDRIMVNMIEQPGSRSLLPIKGLALSACH